MQKKRDTTRLSLQRTHKDIVTCCEPTSIALSLSLSTSLSFCLCFSTINNDMGKILCFPRHFVCVCENAVFVCSMTALCARDGTCMAVGQLFCGIVQQRVPTTLLYSVYKMYGSLSQIYTLNDLAV